jgi:hypothetical protein
MKQVVGRYFSLAVCLYHHGHHQRPHLAGFRNPSATLARRHFSGTRRERVGNRIDLVGYLAK